MEHLKYMDEFLNEKLGTFGKIATGAALISSIFMGCNGDLNKQVDRAVYIVKTEEPRFSDMFLDSLEKKEPKVYDKVMEELYGKNKSKEEIERSLREWDRDIDKLKLDNETLADELEVLNGTMTQKEATKREIERTKKALDSHGK